MRVRGDGRPYQLLLRMDRRYDVQWLDIYTYVLFTRGGPYWQVAKVRYCLLFKAARHIVDGAVDEWHKGVFIATQLNSTDSVEQRTAKSVVFLFMTSRPTS